MLQALLAVTCVEPNQMPCYSLKKQHQHQIPRPLQKSIPQMFSINLITLYNAT